MCVCVRARMHTHMHAYTHARTHTCSCVTNGYLFHLISVARARLNEVSLVLKSVTVLISTLRNAQQDPSIKGK